MRTTLNIDGDLLKKAGDLAGTMEKTALVRLGLEALISRESALRLAKMGGKFPGIKGVRRRRGA